ncbi:leucine--tRNA ligase [Chondromyces apiculatus]|uniref:Leucine--tRNA ligase n=1 Tax=Chondromyces apiculatus DSM 436 TaxID=1192034 RepID=A0A017SVG8_9BACT|nr:leucine--tRNA ligase [Chondromyces apiculatus]EYF00767.1 Leucyl-tRNA synthetase [Chondromyces apiculatus DSM 436]
MSAENPGAPTEPTATAEPTASTESSAAAAEPREPLRYDHLEVEPRWQRVWDEQETFRAVRDPASTRPKRYVLDMFPYPSGDGLHVGHPEGYTATDIMSRYWRMAGIDVLHPMGWDAFGLPAEQYAIRTGTHPSETTARNIGNFKRQLKMLGFSYDWSREVSTTDPRYVRWTQWIFLQLFKKGLAYQDEITVNWCPALGTVLANEEVTDGKSEHGHPVERVPLRQWMLRITAYADRLADDLKLVDWPEGTLAMQRAWIGRSEGATITFAVEGYEGDTLKVFTTRPDTLMGVTYVVLAPEHPIADWMIKTPGKVPDERREAVQRYVAATVNRSDRDRLTSAAKEKTGVDTGLVAVHPITGQKVPVWVADYVLGGYGTGAVMAVPGHDERDFAFARAHGLPIAEVVSPDGKLHGTLEAAFTDEGIAVQSGAFDGLTTAACKSAVVVTLKGLGRGDGQVSYKLRDWVFSRQRYWGEPIPIYFPVELESPDGDPRKGAPHRVLFDQPIAVDEAELPLTLPDLVDFRPGNDPAGALARAVDWRYFQKEGRWYARETNTMPQWAGSCWYYLRFIDPQNDAEIFSEAAYDAWMPVDLYIGGAEHAVLHLLYARFWHKVLHDLGRVKHPEPFTKLVHQGMILGEDGEKMSKSRGNVVNPDDIVRVWGADVLRLYEMFMGPLEAVKPWQSSQIQGVVRFRDRVYAVATRALGDTLQDDTARLLHRTVKKVTRDLEGMSFNTVISTLMIFVNHLAGLASPPREAVHKLILMVSPFAPHVGEELWRLTGHEKSLAYEPWPTWDEALCVDDVVEVPVQVNGKVRGRIILAKDATEDQARAAALESVGSTLAGKQVKKFIYVPGKIANVVVG